MRRDYILVIAFMLCSVVSEAVPADSLWTRFVSPSDETRTKVWWFHGETETTREGITADLEAFKDKGVGGVVYYDQVHGKDSKASEVFSDDWWADLKFAAAEARRLGLTFELNISNGYVSGGPWITPELSMQKVVYRDTLVTADGCSDIVLPASQQSSFRPVATLAFPDRQVADDTRVTCPYISVTDSSLNGSQLLADGARLQAVNTSGTMITMDFGRTFTASSFSYRTKGRGKAATCAIPTPCLPGASFTGAGYVELPPIGELEVSDDGVHYRKVCSIPPLYRSMGYKLDRITVAFAEASGRYFRLNLHDWTPDGSSPAPLMIGGICLSAVPTIDNWEVKAAFRPEFADYDAGYTGGRNDAGISLSTIKDISDYSGDDGALRWRAPKGTWRIIIFGHATTGAKTKHGRRGITGLECDRMSAGAARLQWHEYFGRICDTLSIAGIKPDGLVMDSHEAGAQNWTSGFEHEFCRLRGYDLKPWLPVLCGYVVGTRAESDRVLYDFRRTIADLISDRFYAVIDSLCHASGYSFTAQAIGAALTIAGDNIQAKGRVTRPQGEFWAYQTTGGYDIKEASSAARIYGREIASAEAFTDATYRHSFAQLKSLADFAYAMGNNEFVVCASAYQPWLDRYPGSTANGRQYCLNRNNSLWPMSRPFWDYQARCATMLRQGHAVSSICLYIGDDAPVKLLSHKLPAMPEGYDWDVCTTDALRSHALHAGADGKIATQSGTTYDMFVVESGTGVSPLALGDIIAMARNGVPVCADKESVEDVARQAGWYDAAYAEMLDSLFSLSSFHSIDTKAVSGKNSIASVLAVCGIQPQISLHSANRPEEKVYFSQRSTRDADIFFVYNRGKKAFCDTVTIHTGHSHVELWNPVSCSRMSVAASPSDGALTFVLNLLPEETVFVVSTDEISTCASSEYRYCDADTSVVAGPWTVTFDAQRGGPAEPVIFETLTDWTASDDPRIRYYSGEATYSAEMSIPASASGQMAAGGQKRYLLRLPHINAVARVIINGHEVSTLWCSPWQTDITGYVREGCNLLQIVCANSLVNRIIGDASLPEDSRVTFCFPEFLSPGAALEPSGVVGPVEIISVTAVQ